MAVNTLSDVGLSLRQEWLVFLDFASEVSGHQSHRYGGDAIKVAYVAHHEEALIVKLNSLFQFAGFQCDVC